MFVKTGHGIKFSIFVLGFTAIIVQIILLRQFLSVFSGNELVIGIILANWMLLTGLGSYLGKFSVKIKKKLYFLLSGQLLLGILPIIMVFLLNYLRNIIIPPGKMVSLIEIFFSSLILLTPFCLLAGFLFSLFSSHLSNLFKSNVINKVYAIEAIGSIIGGLLFSFIFLFLFKTFVSLKILLFINFLSVAILLYSVNKKTNAYIQVVFTIILSIIVFSKDIDSIALNYLYSNQEIVYQKDTPYGNLVVTKTADQLNFFENGVSLFSTENTISNEESVHYAMVQHSDPENVLLISGGVSGTISEILKYKISSLDYVEADPWLIEVGKKLTDNISNDSRINIVSQDPRLFIRKAKKKYDIVLINLPNPADARTNRYYSLEFFKELKNVLKKNAVISISLIATQNYISEDAAELHSVLFATIKQVFINVIIIPGNRNYFIASDSNLSYSIAQLTELRKIENAYVNKYYIEDSQILARAETIQNALIEDVDINKDYKPVSYFLQLKYWLSYFNYNFLVVGLIVFIPLFYFISRLNFINLGLFATGFSATSVEIILLIAIQVIFGYVYQMTGIIITLFMVGLVIGSAFMYKKFELNIKNYYRIQYGIGIYLLFVPFILMFLNSFFVNSLVVHLIFLILIVAVATLTGLQFALASKLRPASITVTASTAYGSDLFGSAIGALLVSAFLIPYFGILKVCLFLSVINFIVGTIILKKSNK